MLRCLASIRRGKQIRRPEQFVTGIARHVWQEMRTARRLASAGIPIPATEEPVAPGPDENAWCAPDGVEIGDLITAILLLPHRQREVVYEKYFRELDNKRIGGELGICANAVRQRHTEAVRNLADIMICLAMARRARSATA